MLSIVLIAAAATPMPSITVDPTSVTPGPWGFGAIVVVVIAVVLLLLDMLRRVRRARYRIDVREQLDAEEAERDARATRGDDDPQR